MTPLRRWRRPSLLVKFAALSLLLISVLGVVLSVELGRVIRHRNLRSNEQIAGQLVDFITELSTNGVPLNPGGNPTVEQAVMLKESFDAYS